MAFERDNEKNLSSSVWLHALCDPVTLGSLKSTSEGFEGDKGAIYPFCGRDEKIVDFIDLKSLRITDHSNLSAYDSQNATIIYRNFLDWLFETFGENEKKFRSSILAHLRLSEGMKVLIVGCGLGEDIPLVMSLIGTTGEVHAQDLSKSMVLASFEKNVYENLYFTISNACTLPYASRYFDAVYHFGGINLFGDIRKAISELERVCKIGGKVVFGDEGIAPHLRHSEYAAIAINNIPLWKAEPPLHLLPDNASDIQMSYVLGNCFYVISFSPSQGLPKMNIDVMHKGLRGGSARTRFFGKLEGVTEKTKEKLTALAQERGISIHLLLEELINEHI